MLFGRSRRRHHVGIFAPLAAPLLLGGAPEEAGGAETQLFLLARGLAQRGWRVGMVVYPSSQASLPRTTHGVDVVVQRRGRPLRGSPPSVRDYAQFLVAFLRSLARLDAEVIVQRSAGSQTGLIGVVSRLRRGSFIYSSANVVDFEMASNGADWPARLFGLGIRLADRIVVQTDEQARLCRESVGRPGITIRSVAEPRPPRTDHPEAFLWVGRLVSYKRPDAYVDLARAVPEAKFWMIGVPTGSEGAQLEQEVQDSGRDVPNFELLAPRPRAELGALIGRAVALVNTADYEGMPNVFLEAWSRGVPTLALAHDPDGVIERYGLGGFAHGSQEAFSRLAAEMWQGRHTQEEARRCRDYVADHHALDAALERWEGVFRGLGVHPDP